jgi:branched-chain amino acid transport system substrate-binding protein
MATTVERVRRERRFVGVLHGSFRIACVAAGAALLATASGGVAGAAPSSSGSYQVLVDGPFTGATASLGPLLDLPCKAATRVINQAGGVLGKKLECTPVNNYGDPADAVPALERAFATDKTLVMADGLDSGTAATTVPLVERQNMPFFTTNGLTSFDHQTNPYFWRMSPSDDQNGAAYAATAYRLHYNRIAVIYANNIGASGNIPGTNAAAKKLKQTITSNLTIPGDQTSYSSTVERVVSGKPQALIFYADTQTTATFMSNYSQLTGGKLPPVITAEASITPTYITALQKVVPKSYVEKDIYFVGQTMTTSQPAFTNFSNAMKAIGAPGGAINGVVSSLFTGINIMSLAIDMAHSTKGTVYNADILKIVTASKGAVKVHTYAQGLSALRHHDQIQYVGTSGTIKFNKYHNFVGSWGVNHITASGTPTQVFTIPGTTVLADAG